MVKVAVIINGGSMASKMDNAQESETLITHRLKQSYVDIQEIKELVKEGIDINQANSKGETPLQLALGITSFIRKTIESYLDKGDMRYGHVISGLRKQLYLSDYSMRLIKLGANPKNVYTSEGLTFLGDKITYLNSTGDGFNYAIKLKNFLEDNHSQELYAPDKNGNTPLHILATKNKEYALTFLKNIILEHSNINAQNNQGETPLMYGINNKADESLLLALIEKKANVHKTDKNGNTALHLAVQNENMDKVILALLKRGADINAKNKQGETPITLSTSIITKSFLSCLQKISPTEKRTILNTVMKDNPIFITKKKTLTKDNQNQRGS